MRLWSKCSLRRAESLDISGGIDGILLELSQSICREGSRQTTEGNSVKLFWWRRSSLRFESWESLGGREERRLWLAHSRSSWTSVHSWRRRKRGGRERILRGGEREREKLTLQGNCLICRALAFVSEEQPE